MSTILRILAAVAVALPALAARAEYEATLLEISRAWGLVVADFDNDGHDDLFISGHDTNDRIWYWTASGHVAGAQVFPYTDRHDCDAADVDRNGRLDLYCAVGARHGLGVGNNELWLQDTAGRFRRQFLHGAEDPYGRGRIPVFFDFNHDAWPDIYVTNEATARPDGHITENRVFVGQPGARFVEQRTIASGPNGFQCATRGDVDGDGWDDLAVCQMHAPGHLYVNNRAGDFIEWSTPATAGGWRDVKLADVDGDGRQDLVAVTGSNRLQVWPNTGAGRLFESPVLDSPLLAPGRSVALGDFDGDGHVDIYVVLQKPDCRELLQDAADDLVYYGRPDGRWERQRLPQSFAGCGHLAGTVQGSRVVLLNGGASYDGPNYLLSWDD